METDSDCNNNNWNGYDSDKDKEYVPEWETSDEEQLCNLCAEIELKKEKMDMIKETIKNYQIHLEEKAAMRQIKKKNKDSGKPILCFDLENVLSCPKAEIKNVFYRSKLNVYNMTAHLTENNSVYFAIWTEAYHGRGGNDIASAVYKIICSVLKDHPEYEKFIMWSDSCVPQHRNSMMSFAIAHVIQIHPVMDSWY
ncbi:dna-directed rna polymerases i ii and iii subunit rpabc2 [Holotrichia oblita]|uniref:Dna-directed rna polymerases i ii and iii subunit rpabc2 n=1 Tax=Holotrichia oblita TaxID=644536 RepID=A0ACB9SKU6_HOLOL|nr:dna-directed rna polymerases i ii and iii subunit rpabc2 [Holotrichia oblita]